MKAVGLYNPPGGVQTLRLVDIDIATPTPGPHDLLVAVVATAINPIDCALRAAANTSPVEHRILGWDGAGVVEAVGSDVALFKVGDRVFYAGAFDRPGSNAQFQLVDERIAGHMPQSLLFAEAAALPLSAMTAWDIVFNRLRVGSAAEDAGKYILVIDGAGDVGSLAIQLAKRLGNLHVIAAATGAQAAQWCRAQGADQVIDGNGDLSEQLVGLGIARLDYIACLQRIDRQYGALLQMLKPNGRIAAGHKMPASIDQIQAWQLPLIQSLPTTLQSGRYHQLLNRIARLADTDRLITTLKEHIRGINARNVAHAHALLESGRNVGKIVLSGFH